MEEEKEQEEEKKKKEREGNTYRREEHYKGCFGGIPFRLDAMGPVCKRGETEARRFEQASLARSSSRLRGRPRAICILRRLGRPILALILRFREQEVTESQLTGRGRALFLHSREHRWRSDSFPVSWTPTAY